MWTSPFALFTGLALLAIVPFSQENCSNASWNSGLSNEPVISGVDPHILMPGATQVVVHLTVHYTERCQNLVVDGGRIGEGVTATLSGSPPYVVNGVATIIVNVDSQAPIGAHSITLELFGSDERWYHSISTATLFVTCSGCPPAPILNVVGEPQYTRPFVQVARGTTAIGRFLGLNFINDETVVEFLTPGLSADPNATILVHYSGALAYFDFPIVVAPNAPIGEGFVRVVTPGGVSEAQHINIVANPNYLPPPNAYVELTKVTPDPITAGVDVWLKCEGRGFGFQRQVITDSSMQVTTYDFVSSEANPDEVVVAKISAFGGGLLRVQVKNLVTGLISDDIQINVKSPADGRPAARTDDTIAVHRGTDCDLQVTGIYGDAQRDLLDGTTDASWTGIPGLHFSNTNVSTAGTATTVTVHIHADFLAPLTGNEATNLRIINPHGESNPFLFRVLP
jgi:hypothetical protein